jgi:hypothetical protein
VFRSPRHHTAREKRLSPEEIYVSKTVQTFRTNGRACSGTVMVVPERWISPVLGERVEIGQLSRKFINASRSCCRHLR